MKAYIKLPYAHSCYTRSGDATCASRFNPFIKIWFHLQSPRHKSFINQFVQLPSARGAITTSQRWCFWRSRTDYPHCRIYKTGLLFLPINHLKFDRFIFASCPREKSARAWTHASRKPQISNEYKHTNNNSPIAGDCRIRTAGRLHSISCPIALRVDCVVGESDLIENTISIFGPFAHQLTAYCCPTQRNVRSENLIAGFSAAARLLCPNGVPMRRMGSTGDGDVTAFTAGRDQGAILRQAIAGPFGGQHNDHVADVGASVEGGKEELGGGSEGELKEEFEFVIS